MDRTIGWAPDTARLDQLAINTIRFLAVDAIQKANSGHPGALALLEREGGLL